MADNTTAEQGKTPAERLDALLAKHAAGAVNFHKAHGVWPGPEADLSVAPEDTVNAKALRLVQNDGLSDEAALAAAKASDSRSRSAPYVITTRPNGRMRITLTKDDGSVVAGNGTTVEEAVAALEAL